MIKLIDITKTYGSKDTALTVLDKLSLTVENGDFIAIMGKSGCGKSTLLNIIGGMDRFDSGIYLFENEEVNKYSSSDLAKYRATRVGYVFQAFCLVDDLTASENIELPMYYSGKKKSERQERSRFLLDLMHLSDKRARYPSQLSGGEQQRIAIARAIVNNPSVLLADEPTGNLDEASAAHVMQIFRDLNKSGMTIIMVTHDPDVASAASKQYYMERGAKSLAIGC